MENLYKSIDRCLNKEIQSVTDFTSTAKCNVLVNNNYKENKSAFITNDWQVVYYQ